MRGSPTMACSSIIRTLVAIGSARQPKPIWKSTICEYEPFSFSFIPASPIMMYRYFARADSFHILFALCIDL